jgi:hypothetical protein
VTWFIVLLAVATASLLTLAVAQMMDQPEPPQYQPRRKP